MKLIYCPSCNDVVRLINDEWRMCRCYKVGGQYNVDCVTATIGGRSARVLGISNLFFNPLYPFLVEDGKQKMWKKYYGHKEGDVWWGGYEGEVQLFFIEDSFGPRLRTKVREYTEEQAVVTIVDKRKHWVDGVENLVEVTIPSVGVVFPKAKKKKEVVVRGEEERSAEKKKEDEYEY